MFVKTDPNDLMETLFLFVKYIFLKEKANFVHQSFESFFNNLKLIFLFVLIDSCQYYVNNFTNWYICKKRGDMK